MFKPKTEKEIRCPLEYGLDIFGGKWKPRIICLLEDVSSMRYSEIREKLNGITDTILSASLKKMVEDGIINRVQYDEIPQRVEYSLTDKGISILPILGSICQWSGDYFAEKHQISFAQCKSCIFLSRD